MRTLVLGVAVLLETQSWLEILNEVRNREECQIQRYVAQLVVPNLIDVQRFASKRHVVLAVIAVLTTPIE